MNNLKNNALKLIEELKARNLFFDCTNETKLVEVLTKNKKIYLGFDPTAQSLHLGNYVGICVLKHLFNYGFYTIGLLGGATGLIGDPSFKNAERNLLDVQTVNHNSDLIGKQLVQLKAANEIVNNKVFYENMNLINFLRDVGKLINVAYLLEKEALKNRIQTGLSYTEFTYPLLQGWDFVCLNKQKDVGVQIGGSDQWGNITTGIEMARKIFGFENELVGFTFPLLVDSNNKKFGKSEGNALFLDPSLTHPFKIYQFMLNTADTDLEKYFKAITFLSLDKIKEICETHNQDSKNWYGQKTLAKTVVSEIHGSAVADQCEKLTNFLFSNKITDLNYQDYEALKNVLPTIKVDKEIKILEALVGLNLSPSLGQARKLIASNGISLVNSDLLVNDSLILEKKERFLLIRKGKKTYGLIEFGE